MITLTILIIFINIPKRAPQPAAMLTVPGLSIFWSIVGKHIGRIFEVNDTGDWSFIIAISFTKVPILKRGWTSIAAAVTVMQFLLEISLHPNFTANLFGEGHLAKLKFHVILLITTDTMSLPYWKTQWAAVITMSDCMLLLPTGTNEPPHEWRFVLVADMLIIHGNAFGADSNPPTIRVDEFIDTDDSPQLSSETFWCVINGSFSAKNYLITFLYSTLCNNILKFTNLMGETNIWSNITKIKILHML